MNNVQVSKKNGASKKRAPMPRPASGLAAEAQQGVPVAHTAQIEAEEHATQRHQMIANAAYFRAERRGFEPGHEIDDWLAAEAEIAGLLALSLVTAVASRESGNLS